MLGELSPRLPVQTPHSLCDFGRRFITGQSLYYWVNPNRSVTSTGALAKNLAYTVPAIIPNRIKINTIGTVVTANATSTGTLRIGIYADNGFCYPGTLLLDTGTAAADSGSVPRAFSFTTNLPIILFPGLYWFTTLAQTAAGPTVSQVASAQGGLSDVHFPHASPPATTGESRVSWFASVADGSDLPLVFPVSYSSVTSVGPAVYIQVN